MSFPVTAAQLRQIIQDMPAERAKAVLLAALTLDDGGPDVSAGVVHLRLRTPDYEAHVRVAIAAFEPKEG